MFSLLCAGAALKLDQALLTFHNQLTEDVQVFYTSDYCYKVKNCTVSLIPPCCLSWFVYILTYAQVTNIDVLIGENVLEQTSAE